MQIQIIEADYGDELHRSAIVEVLNSYASDPIGGGEPLSTEVKKNLVPRLQEHPTSLVLLAFDDDHPAGIAVCFQGFSTFAAKPLLNVHDLAVVPDYRGQGIGRKLLEAVESHARKQGCCKLTLEVQDDNSRARHLYESFGFRGFTVANSVTRFLSKAFDSE